MNWSSLADTRVGNCSVVVVCGSGGVGKTTTSAALGMSLACAPGKNVLVLTVDPARRLATALGLERIGAEPVAISTRQRLQAGIEGEGGLAVAMLDPKSVWDRVIDQYSPSQEVADRIMSSRIYEGISSAFVGSQEYVGMEALYELYHAHEFDQIILDTPPSRSALDFLDAPQQFSDFVGARLLSWLAAPSRIGLRAMNFAATPLLRAVDRLLGGEMVQEMAVFIRDIQSLYSGIQQRSRDVYDLMRSPETAFLLVTTPEQRTMAEASYFQRRLKEHGMPLSGVVVNRVLPDFGHVDEATSLAETLVERGTGSGTADAAATGRVAAAEGYLAFAGMLSQQTEASRLLDRFGVPLVAVPWGIPDIASMDAVARVALSLGAIPARTS